MDTSYEHVFKFIMWAMGGVIVGVYKAKKRGP